MREKECKARAVTAHVRLADANNELLVTKGPQQSAHSHPPNSEQIAAEVIKTNIQKKAEEHPELRPSVIIRGIRHEV